MTSVDTLTLTLDELRAKLSSDYSESLCFILVDENTRTYCLPSLLLTMPKSIQNAHILEISGNEQDKNLETFTWIIEQLSEHQADRKSLLINLGGGTICDMGGFVAACFKRGIDFINIPTTLLAMVDAAHGGKTGVNFQNAKNQIGVFAQAKMVGIEMEFLSTLPNSEILSGFAEIIKMSLITSVDFWTAVKNTDHNTTHALRPLIINAIERKMQIVKEDPTEKNIRQILNFGHTFGHAFEALAMETNKKLSHGHAVAMGMLCELWISEKLLSFDAGLRQEISDFILKIYSKFPIQSTDFKKLMQLILKDKKNIHGDVLLVLLEGIGQPLYNQFCSKELCLEALEAYSNL